MTRNQRPILSIIGLTFALATTVSAQTGTITDPWNSNGQTNPTLPTGYRIRAIGPTGFTSFGTNLNEAGQAVGWSDTDVGERGFVWNGSTTLLAPASGATGSRARGISGNGTIAGWNTFSTTQAVLYPNPTTTSARITQASFYYDVNDSGTSVGWYTTPTSSQAFKAVNGVATLLPVLSGDTQSQSYAINSSGTAVGASLSAGSQQAVRWTSNGVEGLGFLPGGSYSVAFDISENGIIVGHSGATSGQRAFRWYGGTMTDLGYLPGDASSTAFGVNDYGWTVGRSTSNVGVRKGYLYGNGSMVSLQSLLVDPQEAAQFTVWDAQAINNSGVIVGTATVNGVNTAYVMTPVTPVPEPATMVALGLGTLATLRRRRRSN